MKFVFRVVIVAVGLLALAALIPGIEVVNTTTALIAALVIGLLNAFVRPIIWFLTIPINLLTLGLFSFVINAFLFWLAAEIVDGFTVTDWVVALIGSILLTLLNTASSKFLKD